MLTKSSILTQSENNAADRQISMIIVITNKGCSQSFFIEPSMITAAVRDALESTLIIKVQLSLTNTHTHFTVCKCVSDLSKYCVHLLGKEGLGPVRGGFPC